MNNLLGENPKVKLFGSKIFYCNSNLFRAMKSAKNIYMYFNIVFPVACSFSINRKIMPNNINIINAVQKVPLKET